MAAFADELAGYDVSKGTLRLSYSERLPAELIGRIAKWCYERYAKFLVSYAIFTG